MRNILAVFRSGKMNLFHALISELYRLTDGAGLGCYAEYPPAIRDDLAVLLAKQTRLSQHTISDITGVSRDTIRKYTSEQPVAAKKTSKGKPEA